MPKGELYIKDTGGVFRDAYIAWGLSLTDGALSNLMTPAPMKELIENTYRRQHGKVVSTKYVFQDDRDLTLEVHFTAGSKDQFYERYGSFCEILQQGMIELYTKYQSGVYYRLVYLSCSSFTNFMHGIAKFTLKMNEPDPTNRDETDKYAE